MAVMLGLAVAATIRRRGQRRGALDAVRSAARVEVITAPKSAGAVSSVEVLKSPLPVVV